MRFLPFQSKRRFRGRRSAPHGAAAEPSGAGHWADGWRRLTARRFHRFCLAVLAVFFLLALYGETVRLVARVTGGTPSYQHVSLEHRYLPPSALRDPFAGREGWRAGMRELARYPLGSDNLGRDVLQRVIQGARIAFHVGVMTSLIALPIGILLGAVGGYCGGRPDELVVWLYSTVASMPGILFVLAIALVVGKGLPGIYLGIGLTTWVSVCRLVRAEVIKHRDRPYVQAARALGLGPGRILFRHILPNISHVIIIVFSLRFPAAVGTEVFISFLGIGVQDEPSWGVMINNARLRLWQGVWWEMAAVTAAIFLLVLAFNALGDGLRDAFDPRLRDAPDR